MTTNTNTEQTIIGLKTQINRQVGLKHYAENKTEEMNELFAHSISEMCTMDIDTEIIENLIWKYVKIHNLWWKGESKKLNIYSTIKDYTNKKGHTFKAHYTQNGNYLCKVDVKKPEPISYEGYFPITREHFDFDNYKKEGKWILSFEPK
jgi:hypothetical protein